MVEEKIESIIPTTYTLTNSDFELKLVINLAISYLKLWELGRRLDKDEKIKVSVGVDTAINYGDDKTKAIFLNIRSKLRTQGLYVPPN